MAVQNGHKFGPDWADLTSEEKSAKFQETSGIRKASHARTKRTCCICDKRITRGQQYRQANGSKWMSHEDCVQEYAISNKKKLTKTTAAAAATLAAPIVEKKDGITIMHLAQPETKAELKIVESAPPVKAEEKKVMTAGVKATERDLEEARKLGYFQAILRLQGLPEDAKILVAMTAAADYLK
jgi:hypothetical protein